MLEGLKQQLVQLLTKAVKEVTSKRVLVRYMSIAAKLGCCDELILQIALCLEKADASWGFVKYMSLHTMQVYFRVSRGMNQEPALSFMEYQRLRQILLWCSSEVSTEAVTKMTIALPDEGLLMWYFDFLKRGKSLEACVQPLLRYSDLTDIVGRVKDLGVDWSQVVRLQSIHPLVLHAVMKPLEASFGRCSPVSSMSLWRHEHPQVGAEVARIQGL